MSPRKQTRLWTKIGVLTLVIGGIVAWKTLPRRLSMRLEKDEIRLATTGKGNWLYHRVVEDPHGMQLNVPGFLLGFEKSESSVVGAHRVEDLFGGRPRFPFDLSVLEGTERRKLKKALGDDRRAFLSHIAHYSQHQGRMAPDLVYSAYDLAQLPDARDAYEEGFRQLDGLRGMLLEAIKDGDPSHLLVMCMGWNTDQQEALRNFNSLVGIMSTEGRESSDFRPLVIGISWDSTWSKPFPKALSYFHKADDADEVGAIWVNWLLRKVLTPVKADLGQGKYGGPPRNIEIVLIGHSFGARVLATALARHQIIRGLPAGTVSPELVSLFVGLQPAFSVDRFNPAPGVSKEGAPLRSFRGLAKKFVLTWSRNDMANPIAFWASHGGGLRGHRGSIKSTAANTIFEQVKWVGRAWENGEAPSVDGQLVAMADVSDSVRHRAHTKGGAAHSDIYHSEIGRLLRDLLERFARSR